MARKTDDDERELELEAWVDRQVAKAPPLSDEVAARIARTLGIAAPAKTAKDRRARR